MFDANARHLKKGTLFFAESKGDLLYCEMLEEQHDNPEIRVITSYKGVESYIYKHTSETKWGFAIFSGYLKDGELLSFIDDEVLEKAEEILKRLYEN